MKPKTICTMVISVIDMVVQMALFSPPFLSKKYQLEIFADQLCRMVPYHYGRKVRHGMIPTARFYRNVFNDGLPDNSCFCIGEENTCPAVGVAETSICLKGAPLVLSDPHFLHSDPALLEKVAGLQPNEEKHSSYIDVHLV